MTYTVAQPTVAEISGTTVTGKQAGKTNITVSAARDGNHNAATTTVELTVVAQPVVAESIADCEVAFTGDPYTYTGSAITPTLTVKKGETLLVADTDYTVTYENNVNAGTATVKIAGKGNYTGELSKNFTIDKAPQTLTVTPSSLNLKVGDTAAITTGGNKGSVSYAVENIEIVSISGNTVTAKKAGNTTITVTAAATENYTAATVQIAVVVTETAPEVALQNGYYSIENNGRAIDMLDVRYDDETPAVPYFFSNQNNQVFYFGRLEDGNYKITVVHSKKALSMDANGAVVQRHYAGENAQKWQISKNANGSYALYNVAQKKYLSLTASSVSGTSAAASVALNVRNAEQPIVPIAAVEDGIYTLQTANGSSYVAPQGNSLAEGTAVLLQASSDRNVQKWRVQNHKDGKVYITNVDSQMMLDLDVASSRINQWKDGWNLNQRWYLESAPDGTVVVKNAATGTVLTANGSNLTAQNQVQNNQNQQWKFNYSTAAAEENKLDNGYYTIGAGDRVIDMMDAKYDEGVLAVSWYFGKQNNQLFKFEKQSDNTYKIVVVHAQKALTMHANGTVTQAHWTGSDNNQKWTVVRDANGNTQLKNVGTGNYLSVSAGGVSGVKTAESLKLTAYNETFSICNIVAIEDGVYQLQSMATQKFAGVAGTAEGTPVLQQDAANGQTQLWRVQNQKDGKVYITNAATGFMLDLDVASNTVNQWTDGWNLNQRWYIEQDGANYRVRNAQTGAYLMVNAAQTTLTTAAKATQNEQLWSFLYQ